MNFEYPPGATPLETQADRVAREQLEPVAHSMQLEAQGVDSEVMALQRQDRAGELLNGSGRELWP